MSGGPFDAADGETFGFVDDGDNVEEPDQRLEERILARDDYEEADRRGTTAEEARDGESLDMRLLAERPDEPGPADDGRADGPGPRSGVLVDDGRVQAVEAGTDPTAGPEQDAVHTVTEEQDRVGGVDGEEVPIGASLRADHPIEADGEGPPR
ncbi:hypothetical protein [Phytomonospora endophytica]|uniref:DUF5709 domain-containing protein n=1 Tax=Phytomonospora endophytica TaxID=714109 RepID=A0A841FKV9_9ACTN|nr:hypothetical protein [Phytomonospora endophytica]MBB6037971.1 hypothetical protein [Phytomonospora endophytica]GIG68870.1 hypothetical protein Pen01_51650 [Phytomonospora endophytica]